MLVNLFPRLREWIVYFEREKCTYYKILYLVLHKANYSIIPMYIGIKPDMCDVHGKCTKAAEDQYLRNISMTNIIMLFRLSLYMSR